MPPRPLPRAADIIAPPPMPPRPLPRAADIIAPPPMPPRPLPCPRPLTGITSDIIAAPVSLPLPRPPRPRPPLPLPLPLPRTLPPEFELTSASLDTDVTEALRLLYANTP
eukprot:384633_1